MEKAFDPQKIVENLGEAFDLENREIITRQNQKINVIFLDVATDKEQLAEFLIKPLANCERKMSSFGDVLSVVLVPSMPTELQSQAECVENAAKGNVVVTFENFAFAVTLRKVAMRSISEPPTSPVLKGPREGFGEELHTNTSLLRRRFRGTDLRLTKISVGKYTKTDIVLAYLESVSDKSIVQKVKDKLERFDVDGVCDSSKVAKYLEERKYSIFRQIGTTEKPDVLTSKMLEGRIGILVDGSPIALTIPYLMIEDLQDGNDYVRAVPRANMIRMIRFLSIVISVLLPAFYVAVQEFQYQMLPLKFLITILNSVNGIPLTPTLEMLLVLVLFEILNETSVRMPKYVGMALSVVGAIVLGETAVKAGLLSSPAVLITALSGIALYCVPDDVGAFSIVRLIFVGLAGVLGVFGIVIGLVVLVTYLSGMNSFDTPYLAPYAPLITADLDDALSKQSFVDNATRPFSIPNKNRIRFKK